MKFQRTILLAVLVILGTCPSYADDRTDSAPGKPAWYQAKAPTQVDAILEAEARHRAEWFTYEGIAALYDLYKRDKDGNITGYRGDLKQSDWQTAFDDFGEALKADPDFVAARQNLAVAHNNLALTLAPAKAIREFHQAIFIDDSNVTTVQNMDAVIKALGKDPTSVADRISLGDEARRSSDLVGAVVEYRAALRLKDDPHIHKTLAQVYQELKQPEKAAEQFAAAEVSNERIEQGKD